MNMEDYINIFTSGLLTCSDEQFDETQKQLMLGDKSIDFIVPRKPKKYSVAGQSITHNNEETGLLQWCKQIRANKVGEVKYLRFANMVKNLPEHIYGAFAGADPFGLSIKTPDNTYIFVLTIHYSKKYLITANQFADFIDQQGAQKEIWDEVYQVLFDYQKNNFNQEFTKKELHAFLSSVIGQQAFENNPDNLITIVLTECGKKQATVNIPDAMQKYFIRRKLSQEDIKIFKANDIPIIESLCLTNNDEDYTLELFQRSEGVKWSGDFPEALETRQEYIRALKKTINFTQRVKSEFAEIFSMALFILESEEALNDNAEKVDEELIKATLKNAGFSDAIIQSSIPDFHLLADFRNFSWSINKLRGILAVGIADVFGGMGSWNDQYFEDEKDKVEYNDLSGQLYRSMKNYFHVLLNC
ncbi:hypothetical protein KAR10_00200 [bacterium]|nr:hypothetical protein [bacterium]